MNSSGGIYLDHNATTWMQPEVAQAIVSAWSLGDANPSSLHGYGREAKRRLEDSREALLRLLGANTSQIPVDSLVFTSGGTESNNLALRGLLGGRASRLLISATEHPSVSNAAAVLASQGHDVALIPVDSQGRVALDRLEALLDTPTRLVSVIWGNHETGVVQAMREIVDLCHARGALVHSDAVQACGKLALDVSRIPVDALTIAAHKMGGPRGIGGLFVRAGLRLEPILWGGSQQFGLRPGTESTGLAVGFARSLSLWQDHREVWSRQLSSLRDRLQAALLDRLSGSHVLGGEAERTPQTSCLAFPGLDRQALVIALDRAGVACSSGSACASGSSEPSPVLQAMGLSREIVNGAIRLSVGLTNTEAEIQQAIDRISTVVEKLRKLARVTATSPRTSFPR